MSVTPPPPRLPESDAEVAALYHHARTARCPALLIIHRIHKQSNVGSIVRSALALGLRHACFVGAVKPVTRCSHVNMHSNKTGRVPWFHMTAAALNLCFEDKRITYPQHRTDSADTPHSSHSLLIARFCGVRGRFSRFVSIDACLSTLESLSYSLVCVEIAPTSVPSTRAVFPRLTALLLGNETAGVAPDILSRASLIVRIPQWGEGSSLNVGVAAAIAMYELAQQWGVEEAEVSGFKYQHSQSEAALPTSTTTGDADVDFSGARELLR